LGPGLAGANGLKPGQQRLLSRQPTNSENNEILTTR